MDKIEQMEKEIADLKKQLSLHEEHIINLKETVFALLEQIQEQANITQIGLNQIWQVIKSKEKYVSCKLV